MRTPLFFLASVSVSACVGLSQQSDVSRTSAKSQTTEISQVRWEQLNPARGDQSPQAADLWGNRKARGPTGFLVQFVDGFSSPPHIHNVAYRGVVIRGLVHNAGADAPVVWMPPGSFWTQPAGAPHITSARGEAVTAYIEIDDGPYLVRPTDQAFATNDEAVNIDVQELSWDTSDPASGSRIASLWGAENAEQPSGFMVAVAAGQPATLSSQRPFRVVVIKGPVSPRSGSSLGPGSLIEVESGANELICRATGACLLYVHTQHALRLSEASR